MSTVVKLKKPYPPQVRFMKSEKRFTAYGGARGGGKSEAVRTKAILLALKYPGAQILILRRTYPELRENHVVPLMRQIPKAIAPYKSSDKAFEFVNGSRIVLGYCDREQDVLRYQGQAYDAIFVDEATHLTEFQFKCLTECLRPSGLVKGEMRVRMYLTCNPGGVGHMWVKRLFVDRNYKQDENPEDYEFIPAKIYDNKFLLKNDPKYLETLKSLPEDRRRAMLDGDWDVYTGQYFPEFRRDVHVCEPFVIPKHWPVYRSFDYGLDMLACHWSAVDERGTSYVFREFCESGLIVSRAAAKIKELTAEPIVATFAPADMQNRQKDTGESLMELFNKNGVPLTIVSGGRVSGWLALKEYLNVKENAQAGGSQVNLKIFKNCTELIRCLPQLQRDDRNVNDVATEPHEITHAPDSIRYYIMGRPRKAEYQTTTFEEQLPPELRTESSDYGEYIVWN